MEPSLFLTDDELKTLTGRRYKSRQIEALRSMALPFWVNAAGRPIVARATIEGRQSAPPVIDEDWVPAVLARGG